MTRQLKDSILPSPGQGRVLNHALALLILIASALAARLLYLWLIPPNTVSGDAYGWVSVRDALLAGDNPYNKTRFLNWPPFWMQCVFVLSKISIASGLPFFRVLQGFLISIELVLLVVLYEMLRGWVAPKSAWRCALIGVSLNPFCILEVCQQLNFDVIVGLWILLAVGMVLKFQTDRDPIFWLFACLFLGLGILAKTIPLCLAPLLFLSARSLRPSYKAVGAFLLSGPAALGVSIIYCLGPHEVTRNVIFYRSTAGYFGISGLLRMAGADRLENVWGQVFEIGYFALLVLLSRWLLRRTNLTAKQIVLLACCLLMAVPALGPGFGTQYAFWFVPLMVLLYALGDKSVRRLILMFMIVMVLTAFIEFGFIVAFGFAVGMVIKTPQMLDLCRYLSRDGVQTCIRLPLFLAYLTFLAAGIAILCSELRSKPAAG